MNLLCRFPFEAMPQSNENERTVTVLFFGAARDVVGQTEIKLLLQATNAATAWEEILEEFPELRRFGVRCCLP